MSALLRPSFRNFPVTPSTFSKVLPYKWEAYCSLQQYKREVYCWASLSSRLRSKECPAIQTGGVLPYKLKMYCSTLFETSSQKRASNTRPPPPHTRQKYEQESGQNMTPNASKRGKLDNLAAIFLFIFFRVARLQNEVGTKDVFRVTNFLTKNAPKFSPNFLSLCFVGPKKSRKIPAKFPAKLPSPKSKKIHQRASAGVAKLNIFALYVGVGVSNDSPSRGWGF